MGEPVTATVELRLDLGLATAALHRVLGLATITSPPGSPTIELGDDRRLIVIEAALHPDDGSRLTVTCDLPELAVPMQVRVDRSGDGLGTDLGARMLDVDSELGEGFSARTARSVLGSIATEVGSWARAVTLANHPSIGLN